MIIGLLLWGAVACAVPGGAEGIARHDAGQAVEVKGNGRFATEVSKESGLLVLHLESKAMAPTNDPISIAYCVMPMKGVEAGSAGISFEIRGDGNALLGSVMVGSDRIVTRAYEATFVIGDEQWRKVVVRWDDFVPNYKPWDKGITSIEKPVPDAGSVTHIAFGRGNHFHRYDTEPWRFEIRNIRQEPQLPPRPAIGPYPTGLSRTRALIDAKEPVNILLLGDSITEFGKDRSYGHHMAEKLEERFGVTVNVVNAGVGGHSVRGGRLVLKRSLRMMPEPDLVCIMYGANDAKAVPAGLTADIFQSQVEALIDDVRRSTGGHPDILLLTGLPRLDKERTKTAGIVEPIVPGIKAAAKTRGAALADPFSVYLKFSQDEIDAYYKDTIHPNAEGFRFLGSIVFESVVEQLESTGQGEAGL